MKKFLAILLLLLSGMAARAQQENTQLNQTDSLPSIFWLFYNNYAMATRYNDFEEAKSALYNMISIAPRNDSLRFNLAYFYYDAQRYPSAILVSMDVLTLNPNHAGALEIAAISYEELGLKDKALTYYEKLYLLTDDLGTLYKMAFLQYELKRYAEAEVNIDILLQNSELDNQKLLFQLSDEEQKEFPMRVAVYNLKGLVKKEKGEKAEAEAAFKKALELAPDFKFAADNLAELNT